MVYGPFRAGIHLYRRLRYPGLPLDQMVTRVAYRGGVPYRLPALEQRPSRHCSVLCQGAIRYAFGRTGRFHPGYLSNDRCLWEKAPDRRLRCKYWCERAVVSCPLSRSPDSPPSTPSGQFCASRQELRMVWASKSQASCIGVRWHGLDVRIPNDGLGLQRMTIASGIEN